MRVKLLHFMPVILSVLLLVGAVTLNRGNETYALSPETEPSTKTESESDLTAFNQDDGEMRGIWVSYMTLDMQSSAMTQNAFEEKFDTIISNATSGGFNTLIVQVRPFCDALYRSEIFPMSHLLTGEQGKDCGYDPLGIMVEKAHSAGLKIHAWINPYRVKTDQTPAVLSDKNPYSKVNSIGVELDSGIYLNPALDKVIDLIVDGVEEIVKNYDVDGIQFDDYFYPTEDSSFDSEQYTKYTDDGGKLSLEDWRKENINKMLREVYRTVHESGAVFGVSPQGNLANNSALGADPALWYTESGYIDYICPQLYFSLDNPSLTFEAALDDWTTLTPAENVRIYIGLAGYKAGSDSDGGTWEDNSDILSREIEIIREKKLDGFMLYSYDSIVNEASQEEIQNVIALLN